MINLSEIFLVFFFHGNFRKRDEGSFEEVRNRGSSKAYSLQDAQSQAPKLSLDNKYGALSQDQS